MTDTETHEVVTYELRLQLQVDVPTQALKAYDKPIDELRDDELLDIIGEDTDLVPDALDRLFGEGDFRSGNVDVDLREEEHEAPKLGRVELNKPIDGIYTLPVPNLISGNVRFTENGIEDVTESNVNVLTDEQLEGAYYAAKRIWGLRGMHRYQKEQLAEFLSELQWGMLARPSRHVFVAAPAENVEQNVDPICSYCGQAAEGHLVREGDTDAG